LTSALRADGGKDELVLACTVGGQSHLVHPVEVVDVLARHRWRLHRQRRGRRRRELLHLQAHRAPVAHRVSVTVEGEHAQA
jgi:hypothetical protein